MCQALFEASFFFHIASLGMYLNYLKKNLKSAVKFME